MTEELLIVFLRNPEPGKVKTRLARKAGDEVAFAVYLKLLSRLRAIVSELEMDKWLFYSKFADKEDAWDNDLFEKIRQTGNDLGSRMTNAFQEAFDKGYKRVVLVGSDIYGIEGSDFIQAFDLLKSKDTVIGPAEDGGYYLIGMNRFIPGVLDLASWSHPAVFQDTIKIIADLGIGYGKLRLLRDIDEWKDLQGTDLL